MKWYLIPYLDKFGWLINAVKMAMDASWQWSDDDDDDR